MVTVAGEVRFMCSPERVYCRLAEAVLQHAILPADGRTNPTVRTTLLTRFETRAWFGLVVTTEEATLDPTSSVTWRHVEGPLAGSVETFHIVPLPVGAVVRYEAEIHARHPLFRGPLERLFVAPMTRRVSLGHLEQLRRELDPA